ncbi:MAG TPA: GNAT family N-acetyltransferase [Isosphaeraceae bacterium]|nr:GNAT family N-acetyltransferase [Isosphaeraceae bacterium]
MRAPSPGARLPLCRGSVEYCLGTEADHEAVYQTLVHVFHGPDRESFLGALSDPAYQPDQRLLAKVDGKVVSHVHLTERSIRYGSVTIPINGVMWVGTLPEFRGMGFAQNLMRLASQRARDREFVLQALTTGMPQFYRPLGWGICGRQCFAQVLSRNLPQVSDGVFEGRGAFWHVRPWRQVELGDLMSLYESQYARTTGTVDRSEEYWRWIIGRRYAHVIWVACQGEAVRGYAFIKDHKVLELAFDPTYPQALRVLLGRVRAEALERAYPEVTVFAPRNHPVMDVIRTSSGRIIDQEAYDGTVSMYHIPDLGRFLKAILPELARRALESGTALPVELGISVEDERWLIHVDRKESRVEPEKLSRRHLTLSPSGLVRLLLGHTGIDAAAEEEGFVASTSTAIDAARILFPPQSIWRSPLDSATA